MSIAQYYACYILFNLNVKEYLRVYMHFILGLGRLFGEKIEIDNKITLFFTKHK